MMGGKPGGPALEPAHPPERGSAQRVAVIRIGEGDEMPALPLAGLPVGLEGHFERALDGRGSVVREKDPFQGPCREKSRQFFRQLPGQRVCEPEKRRMGDFPELGGDRCIQVRMRVAVDVRPDRGIAVDVAVSFGIVEPDALRTGDDHRLVVRRAPLGLAGERVPAVGFVEVEPAGGVVAHGRSEEGITGIGKSGGQAGGFSPGVDGRRPGGYACGPDFPLMSISAYATPSPALQREVKRRRSFAIISHPDAGKTTLTEKFLLYGGALNLAGSVTARKNQRATTSDWMELEKQRGISVSSTVLQFEYKDCVVNILDTHLSTTLLDVVWTTEENIHLLQGNLSRLWDEEDDV